MRDNTFLAVVGVSAFALLGWVAWLGFLAHKSQHLDLLRRVESVQWRQGDEEGRECPICKKDTPGHLEGCELAEALETK